MQHLHIFLSHGAYGLIAIGTCNWLLCFVRCGAQYWRLIVGEYSYCTAIYVESQLTEEWTSQQRGFRISSQREELTLQRWGGEEDTSGRADYKLYVGQGELIPPQYDTQRVNIRKSTNK